MHTRQHLCNSLSRIISRAATAALATAIVFCTHDDLDACQDRAGQPMLSTVFEIKGTERGLFRLAASYLTQTAICTAPSPTRRPSP
jgi:hypothetical protein